MPFWAIRGAAFERRKRTKSLGLPHREAGVFIVFVGIPDIFIIFAPKIKLQRYGTERRYRKNREQNYRHSR